MAERDAAMAERDAALAEKLEGLVKAVSESAHSKISNLSALVDGKLASSSKGCKNNGRCLRTDGWKKVQPDDKEAAITQAEHRIRMVVQRDADERWKDRMANEDKITTNAFKVLRSDLMQ